MQQPSFCLIFLEIPRSVEGESHVLATAAVQVFAVTLRIKAFDDTKCYKHDCLGVVVDLFEMVVGGSRSFLVLVTTLNKSDSTSFSTSAR